MAFKANFKRREGGGYDATYGKGQRKQYATILQSEGMWRVTAGLGADTIAASKTVGTVKEGWAALAESVYGGDANTATTPIVRPLSGPPSLNRSKVYKKSGGPPPLPKPPGPPTLRHAQGLEPAGYELGGEIDPDTGKSRFLPVTFDHTMKKFGENPSVPKAGPGVASCFVCHRPLTGWREEDGRFLPPCRCNEPNSEDYEPDRLDPRMYERVSGEDPFSAMTPIGALDMVYAWMRRNEEYVTTDGKLTAPWSDVQKVLFRVTGYAEYRPERLEKP